ncbi:MAG: histidinol-phosphatase, partial [Bacteroidetes bacterium]|nr:histidinol-phosphatase [Bacteroidota bacterium]
MRLFRLSFIFLFSSVLLASCGESNQTSWKRGNLHPHSFWSDGDDFPESILAWYRDNGYDFVAISDHNTLADTNRWIQFDTTSSRYPTFVEYVERFGSAWVESEIAGDSVSVRLKRFEEYKSLFDDPGHFLVIRAEEITDRFEDKPIHVNATNIDEFIAPQGGSSVLDVMQRNVNAVLEQRERTGRPMIPHINHPNFGWAIGALELAALEGERFIEVYNGHPAVHNEGDSTRPSVENMWDIANTVRALEGRALLLGLAIDDAHNYQEQALNRSNTGRGWIMVETDRLTASALIESMEAGSFYASSGVTLEHIEQDAAGITISVSAEEGVEYRIAFIGTLPDG